MKFVLGLRVLDGFVLAPGLDQLREFLVDPVAELVRQLLQRRFRAGDGFLVERRQRAADLRLEDGRRGNLLDGFLPGHASHPSCAAHAGRDSAI
jgi:hypothetical protein